MDQITKINLIADLREANNKIQEKYANSIDKEGYMSDKTMDSIEAQAIKFNNAIEWIIQEIDNL